MREKLKTEKIDFYEARRKAESMRASTVLDGTRASSELRAQTQPRTENRFVGGGFSVSQSRNNTPSKHEPLLTMIGIKTPIASPHIVTPVNQTRAKTSMKTRLPLGWNPKRGQLQPYLPTVSTPIDITHK